MNTTPYTHIDVGIAVGFSLVFVSQKQLFRRNTEGIELLNESQKFQVPPQTRV